MHQRASRRCAVRNRTMVAALVAGTWLTVTAGFAAAEPAEDTEQVPPRTAISVRTDIGMAWGTGNEHERRGALSLAKLYLVDYALRHGDGSAQDLELGERMIRYSDDGAASTLAAKYPGAIEAIATEYGLTETAGADWTTSSTSTADVATFLAAKTRTDPASPILGWMATAAPTAADGTPQDWGTAQIPGVLGTKWGWSDFGVPEVASASFGPGFTVAAHTYGSPDEQTADVLGALVELPTVLTGP
ncbi:hypothetical protein IU443_18415 [Nocardia farcinica]|nr:hypothetical protein [Nocardia farcinica]AXK87940.1 hypothetical protein DXT66_22025 [Nocardia farcinica]MBA4858158.1 hypothetical protein [Nocardia farcinica]MBC9816688.1 hypothetical protein [Nocardia farcinica]MBF6069197.1 hypothetical protein [Nocardia farcinica]MBF6252570.1 hypothetical protein [Nocardia farcinica]